jgi:uncharacterized OsmC-like protein
MDAIAKNPICANAVFRAQTELEEDVRCTVKVRDFKPMAVDEPPELGGTNSAMNPVELILGALGTCQEIMYSAYAAVMGIKLDRVKVDVKGTIDLRGLFAMDASAHAGYKKITYETTIESAADASVLQKLVDMVESHCPVLDTLTRAIDVKGEVSINGKKSKAQAAAN